MVVHYRKIGVLRRLRATPLMPFAFLAAQVLSRLLVVLPGALCLISLGLIVSARLRTEELADGILNLLSWPMPLLSGIWFSLEGTSAAAQALSQVFPVTHLVTAAGGS